ncbi:MAG: hypothetical protein J0H68_00745 [Sphingobacteriia bacterium]|nr:hypothetical protein [Sphingobacteriia bacterium]
MRYNNNIVWDMDSTNLNFSSDSKGSKGFDPSEDLASTSNKEFNSIDETHRNIISKEGFSSVKGELLKTSPEEEITENSYHYEGDYEIPVSDFSHLINDYLI